MTGNLNFLGAGFNALKGQFLQPPKKEMECRSSPALFLESWKPTWRLMAIKLLAG